MFENQRKPSRVFTVWWPVVLMFLLCSPIYLDYWCISSEEKQFPGALAAFFNGQSDAPGQYRIAIPWLARSVSVHFHIGMRHAFGAIDLLASWITILLLYKLLRRSLLRAGATWQLQLLSNAFFAGLTLFYFVWLDWFQRVETLPSAAFVAITLSIVVHGSRSRGGTALAGLAIIGLATMQGLVRADVAVSIHLAIVCVCIRHRHKQGGDLATGPAVQAVVSVLALVSAWAVQIYVMRVLYPRATYGGTPVIQAIQNLTIGRAIPFALSMLPVIVTWLLLLRRRAELETGARIVLVASMVYLALWFAVGSIAEVRIFLPFALALSPWTAMAIAAGLMRAGSPSDIAMVPVSS
jgi:hypothetical protein